MKPLPDLKRLHTLFEVTNVTKFGLESGLKRKIPVANQKKGDVAGCLKPSDKDPDRFEWVVSIDNEKYYVARIIYKLKTKNDPKNCKIDHIDRNTLNNNITNLRLDVDNLTGQNNKEIHKNNKSGARGVSWQKSARKWKVCLKGTGKKPYLGLFECKIEAAIVYNEAVIENIPDYAVSKLNDVTTLSCTCSQCVYTRISGNSLSLPGSR